LFCGVEAASFNGAFIEATRRNNYQAENIAHGDKVGKVAIRTTTISDTFGYQSKLIFMKHPSRSFSWKKWSELLRERMPEYIKSLLN
jgi:hypothetical protein